MSVSSLSNPPHQPHSFACMEPALSNASPPPVFAALLRMNQDFGTANCILLLCIMGSVQLKQKLNILQLWKSCNIGKTMTWG